MASKAQIPYPVFLWKEDEAVIIGDGTNEVQFSSLEQFQLAETGFVLPDNAIQINYEQAPSRGIYQVVTQGGQVGQGTYPNDAYDAYLLKVTEYATFLEEITHPLYGITDLAEAQTVAQGMIIEALEGVFSAAESTQGYMSFEQGTFERQLAEAEAYKADPENVETPWLSAILKDGETLEALADIVIANHIVLRTAASSLMRTKRNTIQAMQALTTVEEVKAYVDNFLTSLEEEE